MSVSVEEITIGGTPGLDAFLVEPDRRRAGRRGLVLCHGFPSAQRPGLPNRSYQLLAERIAAEQGWSVLAVSLRGCGDSAGQFSMEGWIEDLGRAAAELRRRGVRAVWAAGSTTGGSLAILAAARDPDIRGVAVMAARSDFDDWANEPRRFVAHCRSVGVISDGKYPSSLSEWAGELRRNRPIDKVADMGGRPLLILHGLDDRQVPAEDARQLGSAHGSAEVRLIPGADHRIRHDPRAVAILIGWLERQTAS